MKHHQTIWLLVVLSTFFWGSNFNAAAATAGSVTPLTAAAERFGVALILFWLLPLFSPSTPAQYQPTIRDFFALVPLGIIGVFGFNFAFFTAMHSTSALNAALIMALSPMISVLFSKILLEVQLKPHQYLGMAIAFVGVTLVITSGKFALLHVAQGDLWMLVACGVWSLYSVGSKRFAPQIPPLPFARWTVSIGALALIFTAFLIEHPQQLLNVPLKDHAILIYMGVCGSVLAYIFWLKGIHFLGPERSAIAFNLVPVFTLLVNLALGSIPTFMQIMGMLLVLCGVLISNGWQPHQTAINRINEISARLNKRFGGPQ